jgi:hypothetical protein
MEPAEVSVEIDDITCRIAIDGLPSLVPRESFKATVEQAEKAVDPDGSALRRVRCSAQDASDLGEYLDQAAAELQMRGDYERSIACAQGAERIRRTLEGHPRRGSPNDLYR